MHPHYITPEVAAWNAQDEEGPIVAGWYVHSDAGWDGPFDDYPETLRFIEYCESEDRLEARHNRTLGVGI